jgi:hypothetical protein
MERKGGQEDRHHDIGSADSEDIKHKVFGTWVGVMGLEIGLM